MTFDLRHVKFNSELPNLYPSRALPLEQAQSHLNYMKVALFVSCIVSCLTCAKLQECVAAFPCIIVGIATMLFLILPLDV